MRCTLCGGDGNLFFDSRFAIFYRCKTCDGLFRDQRQFLTPQLEKERYAQHQNDIEDERYVNFVQPLIDQIKKHASSQEKGLDFGAGEGPVISHVLQKEGFNIKLYDPFFHPNDDVLNDCYDYIFCCEVIEHFNHPEKEFRQLYNMLDDGGKLLVMTHFYDDDINFSKWYYKNDKTHVFFYTTKTIDFIKNKFGFNRVDLVGRTAVFFK